MGFTIDFDLSTVLIFFLIWIGVITFLRKKKGKSFVFLLFFTIFFVYFVKVLDYTQFPMFFTQSMRETYGQTVWKTMNFIPLFTLNFSAVKTSLLNVLITIPFGFGLPFITNFRMRRVITAGLFFSITLEILQLMTALIAGFTFRIVDINDVIFNTIGAALGYLLFFGFILVVRFVIDRWRIPLNPFLRYISERPQVST